MPHTYACPMRWADMDLLAHVNNVTYLDYVTEAREAFLAEALGAGPDDVHRAVREHRLDFVAPLVFGRRPALVDTWVVASSPEQLVLAHEVHDDTPDGRVTHLRATTVLEPGVEPGVEVGARAGGLLQPEPDHDWRPVQRSAGPPRHSSPVVVRRSDLGVAGEARDDAVLEYFQEARIRYFTDLHTRGEDWGRVVVARTDLRLVGPAPRRREAAYDARARIGHLGSSSFTVEAELVDPSVPDERGEPTVLATSTVVLVCFDPETQRPRPMPEAQRVRLQQELS
ncbi:acyl-CoA thioester hydrolase [Nocardioides scoriae]|uniref:Acyl-CoA thioester hydrolase n=1 Tax=Nocardioides scoriae TaxID=642780 RepID=A0A1H1LQF7_9ACTN|nr:thioesterase family protein [Nocardioides scoriae]SDR76803.1 acyl-CoA thioester hydrolase [Nocardioides scoriae]